MTSDGRVVAVRGTHHPDPPDVPGELFDDALDLLHPLVTADDVSTARTRIDELGSRGQDVDLAIIGPRVADPLVAAGALRRANERLRLAFAVRPARAESVRRRIEFVPDLRGSVVVVAEGSPDELAKQLREAAVASARRNEVETTIAALNRQLMQRATDPGDQSPRASVSESYLAALVRHVPDAIVSVDRDRRMVALNEAAISMLGLTPDQLTGATLQGAIGRYTDEHLDELVDQALAGATITGQELEFVTPGTGRLLVAATAAPVRDRNDDIVGAVLVVRDITEQRRTNERLRELQKAQSLATLAGGVAHDFNNLLVTIKSWSQIAAEDPTDVDLLEEALERIQDSADRAADLARAMLVYSGRGRFEMEAVDLTGLAREMAALLRGTISRKIDLDLQLDDQVAPVEGDATQLRQVLMNLITNAAEAIGDAPGTITVCTRGDHEPDDLPAGEVGASDRYVLVEVSDTGPGMAAETRERVFEPFFTTKFEGRGLGLAASHGIVRAHGGVLLAESEPGRGATFRMMLPAGDQGERS